MVLGEPRQETITGGLTENQERSSETEELSLVSYRIDEVPRYDLEREPRNTSPTDHLQSKRRKELG